MQQRIFRRRRDAAADCGGWLGHSESVAVVTAN